MAFDLEELEKKLPGVKEYVKLMKEANDAANKSATASEKELANAEALFALREQFSDFAKLSDDFQQNRLIYMQTELENNITKGKLSADEIENQKAFIDLLTEAIGLKKEELDTLIDITEEEEKQRDATQERNKELEKTKTLLKSIGERWAGIFGMGKKFSQTLTGGVVVGLGEMAKLMKDNTEEAKKMAAEFAKGFGSRFIGLIATQTEELIKKQDQMIAGFFKATGATANYGDIVYDTSETLRSLGLGVDGAGDSVASLYKGMSDFVIVGKSAKQELADFTATMNIAGVDSGKTTKVLAMMNRTLRLSTTDSITATKEFLGLARTIGMDLNQAIDGVTASFGKMAAYGKDARQVMGELMVISKQSQVAMGELVSVGDKFITFESAAQTIARLNAMLGGTHLDVMSMVYGTHTENLMELHRAVNTLGVGFDELGPHMQRAITNTSGLKDVATASQFFNSSLEIGLADMEKHRLEQEEMHELAKSTQDIFTRLTNALMKLAVSMKPFIDGIISFVEGLSSVISAMGPFGAYLFGIIGIAAAVGLALGPLILQLMMIRALSSAPFIGPVLPGGGGMLAGLGGGLARFGLPLLGAGLGIGLMTKGETPEGKAGYGMAGGALTGASIGTMILPGAGTVVGGLIGGALGGLVGAFRGFQHGTGPEGMPGNIAGARTTPGEVLVGPEKGTAVISGDVLMRNTQKQMQIADKVLAASKGAARPDQQEVDYKKIETAMYKATKKANEETQKDTFLEFDREMVARSFKTLLNETLAT